MYASKNNLAVLTLNGFTLTDAKPCAVVSVRTVLSNYQPWLFPLARETDHLHFVGLKVMGHQGNQGLPGNLGAALNERSLNGTAIYDIGTPIDLGQEHP
jgi:hypothetical protein